MAVLTSRENLPGRTATVAIGARAFALLDGASTIRQNAAHPHMAGNSRRSSAWPGIADRAIRHSGLAWLLPLAILAPLPWPLSAQESRQAGACEERLVKPSPDPYAYKPRGPRCEGLYLQNVSSVGSLTVVSFTTVLRPVTITRNSPLLLEWDAPPDAAVTLRATNVRRPPYYRMDAALPAGVARFEWETDVLVPLGLKLEELGLVAWSSRTIGNTPQEVYVPIRVAGTTAASGPLRYVFRVLPARELRELHVTLAHVNRSGHDEKVIVNNEPLRRGPYLADRAIAIPLPPLPGSGMYRLQLNALLQTGAPLSLSLYFEHAGG